MPKPKRPFAERLGGKSSAADVDAFQEEARAKEAPAKERPKAAAPLPLLEPVQPPLPFDGPAYDFRALPDPERTSQRVRALLTDSRLTHGERAAAALLVFQFQDKDEIQLISVKKVLTESRGFSCSIRDKVLSKLSALGLIRARWLRGKGTEIELLF